VLARIATFEGGDVEEMRRLNNEMLVERPSEVPAGVLRVRRGSSSSTRGGYGASASSTTSGSGSEPPQKKSPRQRTFPCRDAS
jgi:hypothetical protein